MRDFLLFELTYVSWTFSFVSFYTFYPLNAKWCTIFLCSLLYSDMSQGSRKGSGFPLSGFHICQPNNSKKKGGVRNLCQKGCPFVAPPKIKIGDKWVDIKGTLHMCLALTGSLALLVAGLLEVLTCLLWSVGKLSDAGKLPLLPKLPMLPMLPYSPSFPCSRLTGHRRVRGREGGEGCEWKEGGKHAA